MNDLVKERSLGQLHTLGVGMLGGRHSQPLSGRPARPVLLCVSPGVGMIFRGSAARGRVPLSPRGQRLMHSDGVRLHLALQAVHLLPGETGGKGRRAGQAARKGPAAAETAVRGHVAPSGASDTDKVTESKGRLTPPSVPGSDGPQGCVLVGSARGGCGGDTAQGSRAQALAT